MVSKRSDDELAEELQAATDGLLFMSESDYPFAVIRWKGSDEITPDYLRRVAKVDAESPVAEVTLSDFFGTAAGEQDWKGEAELATARRYQELVRLLEGELEAVRAYRVGEINIAVYAVGRSSEGNWMGVSTRVVET